MPDPRRAFVLSAIVAIVLAACGGTSSSSAPTDAAAQPTTNAATETPAVGRTDAPAATPVESQSGGGGGSACDLATTDEIGGILDETGVTIEMNTPGEVSYCIYSNAGGDPLAATAWTQRGGSEIFAAWKSGAGAEGVDGLGDDAVFDPASATLLVLKGDAIFSVTAGDGSAPEAQRLDWSKAIAEIALGRM